MKQLHGQKAIDSFLQQYKDQVQLDDRGTKALKLNFSLGDETLCVLLERVYNPEVGGDEKTGMAFTLSQLPLYAMDASIATVLPGSDLAFYLQSQITPNFQESVPVYDIASLIPHDDGHHDVNFVWVESLTDIVIPSTSRATALSVLFDYMEALAGSLNIDAGLTIGERARLYESVVSDKYRLGLPSSCSRPVSQKMLKDVETILGSSAYGLESGKGYLVEKNHQVKRTFMESLRGKRVAIIDDLNATNNTLKPFVATVEQHGGIPVPIVVDRLDYLAGFGVSVVPLGYKVHSIFEEKTMGVPTITQEMKQAWNTYHKK